MDSEASRGVAHRPAWVEGGSLRPMINPSSEPGATIPVPNDVVSFYIHNHTDGGVDLTVDPLHRAIHIDQPPVRMPWWERLWRMVVGR